MTLIPTQLRLALIVATTLPAAALAQLSYNSGDLFIGFRQDGVANTLVANLGPVTNFLPSNLGGTWSGNSFNVTFGFVPNTSTPLGNLNADLVANFGLAWATNSTTGTSVRWGLVGATEASTTIPGYATNTAFLTRPRLDPSTPSTLTSGSNATFANNVSSFATGAGGGSYTTGQRTANSTVAYSGPATDANNWGTRIQGNASFGFGSNRNIEQFLSGDFQGPTNSVLDLWVVPGSGSTITTARTFTGGSFTLGADGTLTYGIIPEPGSATLLALGLTAVGMTRRRRSTAASLR